MGSEANYSSDVLQAKVYSAYLKGKQSANKSLANIEGIDLTDFYFQPFGNTIAFRAFTDKTGVEWYRDCPALALICNRKAVAFNVGEFKLMDKNRKDPTEIESPTHPLIKLYNQPNPLQTHDQFKTAVKGIYEIYGVCFVLQVKPFKSIKNNAVSELWILPNQYVTVKWNSNYVGVRGIHDMIDEIRFGENGKQQIIPKEDVYLFTDLGTSLTNMAIPQSRLEGVKSNIDNIIRTQETKSFIIQNRGAQGILSNAGKDQLGAVVPLDAKAEEDLQNKYRGQKHGIGKGQWDLIITNLPLTYNQMGYNPKDLMLQEFMKDDVTALCAVMGYRYALLFDNETTFNNQLQYEKNLYTSTLIPEGLNYVRQYNECVGANASGLEWVIDWDDLECLQADKTKEADVRSKDFQTFLGMFMNCLITYGRFAEGLGETNPKQEWVDKYWPDLTDKERELFVNMGKSNNQKQDAKANN